MSILTTAPAPRIAVLALQGGVAEHVAMLESLGAEALVVRSPRSLAAAAADGLVLPGGESSTVDRLLRRFGMREPLIELLDGGLPVLGTCAGLITLAEVIRDPAPGQQSLGLIPMTVRRNAFGRQVDSATETLDSALGPVKAAFIRAPEVVSVRAGVEILARRGTGVDGDGPIVAVGTGQAIALSFHPELTGDTTFHGEFLRRVRAAKLDGVQGR
ncbi:pyridoxal 5'-phosphate synthase glutaminase subunit PdxT [Kocuria coralli]|uniref:Pyridoxal 5'-phosphate synthase subunit PdxT n=1 Tax=Kocuria coralli TaxID=1461025 RepID=A0A5J5KYF8_9MICC|nr:pyridoxal 5'-phosphate synthase glutaminase subunit PdxT [Kocuria coralli]KAA9393925.1 pyridoxal 5'-phosphate synthase glutaminase subunit PdxT [Kocuria coralli]